MTVFEEKIHARLATVLDPEIRRPITELGMVDHVEVTEGALVNIRLLLTVAHCPMRDMIVRDVEKAVGALEGVNDVCVNVSVMNDRQREQLRTKLRNGSVKRRIPFNDERSLTNVYAVASGKGGVGKSTVTANVAVALAQQGLSVGIVDADIYGFSIPKLLGVTAQPTQVGKMMMPPLAWGVKVISMGMFVGETSEAVAWRGPRLHRAVEQFLSDVYFGDLDILLLDLPPGTGDIAISLSQLLPKAQLLVVTTPQQAAADVAERAGSVAIHTKQKIAGVIENMSAMMLPDGSVLDVFGAGGGQELAERLSARQAENVPLLGSVPLNVVVRRSGDDGRPIVLEAAGSAAAEEFRMIAAKLAATPRDLAGKNLGVMPVQS